MENNEKDHIQLPDNAFTELKPGEEYQPVMEPGRSYPEVNLWSVTWGHHHGDALLSRRCLPRTEGGTGV